MQSQRLWRNTIILKEDAMNDFLTDRCKVICGDSTSGCFCANAGHDECISGSIISKVWSAREIIEMGASRNRNNDLAEILDMAIDEMDELIIWMQRMRALGPKREMREKSYASND